MAREWECARVSGRRELERAEPAEGGAGWEQGMRGQGGGRGKGRGRGRKGV